MAAIPLKPQYGPTLGQVLAPRWREARRPIRMLIIAAAIALLAVVVGAALTLENAHYSHGGPAPFSFSYRDLYRTTPAPGEFVRVHRLDHNGHLKDSFAVGPLLLPPYSGAVNGELPLYASAYIEGLRRRYAGFVLRGEGKTRVNTVPAYTIFYSARIEGRRVFGRDILLLPERPHPRAGVRIVMLTSPGANSQVNAPVEVGTAGVLERPLETFTIE